MRKIDPSLFVGLPRPADFGPAGQLQWIEITLLVVDDDYQRPIAEQGIKNVREIMSKFDWRMFAPVVVSPVAGGKYAIVDGQHRTTAAAAVGHDQVPCLVIMADRHTQAAAFAAINGNVTKVSTQQQFKASLAAGDPRALRIKAVADAADVRILFYNTAAANMRPRETTALDALKRTILRHGDEVATTTLLAIGAAAAGEPGLFKSAMIQAVSEVLFDHPEWLHHRKLLPVFEDIPLEEWRARASAEAAMRKGVTGQLLLQAKIIEHLESRLVREAA